MKNKRGRTSLSSVLVAITIALLAGGIALIGSGGGAFFGKLAYGISDYNSIQENELKKDLPMQGTIYYIYDCIVTEYTKNSDTGVETVDAYYYAVPFEGNSVLLVKVDADSYIETQMDKLYYAPDNETYEYMFETGVNVEGVLVKNDSEVLDFFDEWKDEYESDFKYYYSIDISDFEPVAYTLDCTNSIQTLCTRFIIGAVMVIATILLWVIFIVVISKKGKNNAPIGAYGTQNYGTQNYGTQNYGQNNAAQPNYGDTTNSFIPQQSNINTQQNAPVNSFIPQSSTNTFQSQQSNNTQPSSSFGFGAAPQADNNKVDLSKN